MKILLILAFIAILVTIVVLSAMASISYDKEVTKMALREYEDEKRRWDEYDAALQEIDDLEKELNEREP